MKRIFLLGLAWFAIGVISPTFAQSSDPPLVDWSRYDYMPGQQVLFYDDFTGDREGEPPKVWTASPDNKVAVAKFQNQFWLQAREEATVSPSQLKLTPQYTLEMDFYVFAEGYSGRYRVDLVGSNVEEWASLTLEPQAIFFSMSSGLTSERPVDLKTGVHHLALQIDGSGCKAYVDYYQVINIPKGGAFAAAKIEVFMPGAGDDANDNHCRLTNFCVSQGPMPLPAQLTASGKIVSYGIYFERGKENVLPASTPVLKQFAELLQTDATLNFSIECHDNEKEQPGENAKLSEARAEAIKDMLVEQYRINSDRLEIRGWGEGKPLADAATVDGHKMNQRVEFIRK